MRIIVQFLAGTIALGAYGACDETYSDPGSNVWSLNIVGYVTLTNYPGYSFVANPLAATNDSLTYLFQQPADGTRVYLWDVPQQAFLPPATFHTNSGWDTNFDLPVGRGFVVQSPAQWVVTFVGEVLLNSTNLVAGSNRFSLLGSKLPQEGTLSSNLCFPEIAGASAYLFKRAAQSYSDAFNYFDGFGWFDPKGVADPGGPQLKVAESFFVQNPAADTNWIRHFSIGPNASRIAPMQATRFDSLSIRDGKVSLQIRNAEMPPYDIQFSSDGRSWKTIAKNQTGARWSGAFPAGRQGYYRLHQPQSGRTL